MSTDSQPPATPKWMAVLGWVITVLTGLMLFASAFGKFLKPPPVVETFTHLGWHDDLSLGVGILELACVIAYLIPRTAVLGAILLTGYMGGAVATHVRVGDPLTQFIGPFLFGFLVWLGLLLRDERVRAVLPLRSPPGGSSWPVKIAFALVTLLVALVAIVALQPAEFHVERSITIKAPAAEVFPHVNDLHRWEGWSPWLKIDPNAKGSYDGSQAGPGAIFRWKGNSEVGAGSMTITDSRPSEFVKIKLDFDEPMPGTSQVEFTFKEESGQTLVAWKMHGQNSFASKAVHLVFNMDKMVGGYYEQGLASLKAQVEAKK